MFTNCCPGAFPVLGAPPTLLSSSLFVKKSILGNSSVLFQSRCRSHTPPLPTSERLGWICHQSMARLDSIPAYGGALLTGCMTAAGRALSLPAECRVSWVSWAKMGMGIFLFSLTGRWPKSSLSLSFCSSRYWYVHLELHTCPLRLWGKIGCRKRKGNLRCRTKSLESSRFSLSLWFCVFVS